MVMQLVSVLDKCRKKITLTLIFSGYIFAGFLCKRDVKSIETPL